MENGGGNHSCIFDNNLSNYRLVILRTYNRVSYDRLTQKTCLITQVQFDVLSLRFPMPIFDKVYQILNLNYSMPFQRFLVLAIISQKLFFNFYLLRSYLSLSSQNFFSYYYSNFYIDFFSSRSRIYEFSWLFLKLYSKNFKSLSMISLSSRLSSETCAFASFSGKTLCVLCLVTPQVQLTQRILLQVRQYSVRTLLWVMHRSCMLLLCIKLKRSIQAYILCFLWPSSSPTTSTYAPKSQPLLWSTGSLLLCGDYANFYTDF